MWGRIVSWSAIGMLVAYVGLTFALACSSGCGGQFGQGRAAQRTETGLAVAALIVEGAGAALDASNPCQGDECPEAVQKAAKAVQSMRLQIAAADRARDTLTDPRGLGPDAVCIADGIGKMIGSIQAAGVEFRSETLQMYQSQIGILGALCDWEAAPGARVERGSADAGVRDSAATDAGIGSE